MVLSVHLGSKFRLAANHSAAIWPSHRKDGGGYKWLKVEQDLILSLMQLALTSTATGSRSRQAKKLRKAKARIFNAFAEVF